MTTEAMNPIKLPDYKKTKSLPREREALARMKI
jgi:hypothetical protein